MQITRFSIKKIKNYLLNRKKSGVQWKLGTTIITLIILFTLYSRGIIAIATINNKPVNVRDLIVFLRRDNKENIIDKAITQKIIELEAQKRNILISKQETEEEIVRLSILAAENGKTIYELLNTVEQDSIELEKNVKVRMMLYQIISSGDPITGDQIDKYVEQNLEMISPQEEEVIKLELKYLLLNNNVSMDYDSWIKEVNASTDINYFKINLDNI